MSDHDYTLKLSHEALDDITHIQNYTYLTYGEDKWVRYGNELDQGLQKILKYPNSGHKRKDLPMGYLALNVQEHVLIYRIEEVTIFLVRVLHRKMDFRFHIS